MLNRKPVKESGLTDDSRTSAFLPETEFFKLRGQSLVKSTHFEVLCLGNHQHKSFSE